MKLSDFLCKENIIIDFNPKSKELAISELVESLKKSCKIENTTEIIDVLLQREKLGSTGIGQGMAVPHGRTNSVSGLVCALGIVNKGIDFNALDNKPVNLIFLIVSPVEEDNNQLLNAMARISRMFRAKSLRQAVLSAKTSDEVISLIKNADK